jgi:hypothetical protein
MDVDRRRKTVSAGTFAIERKSLSNAQPISPVGSQLTPVISMLLPSMHSSGGERVFAPGLPHSEDSVGGRATAHAKGRGWPSILAGSPRGGPGGKIATSATALPFAPRCLLFFPFQNLAKCFGLKILIQPPTLRGADMAKSGMSITRTPSPKSQPSRPIKRFTPPPPAPSPPAPSSNQLAAEMKRIAEDPPGIDPRQQVY